MEDEDLDEFILPDLPQDKDFKLKPDLNDDDGEIKGGEILLKTEVIENLITDEQLTAQTKSGGKMVCLVCSMHFGSNRNELLAHELKSHPNIRPFQCNVCPKSFKLVNALKNHFQKSHPGIRTDDKPFKCPSCSLTFETENEVLAHSKGHQGPKPIVCEICGVSTRTRYNMSRHMLTHTGEKSFKCAQCSKSFKSAQYLRRHLKSRSACEAIEVEKIVEEFKPEPDRGLRSHVCGECGRGFLKPVTLKRHELYKHSGLRAYPCPLCTKRFVTNDDRKKHLKLHSGEKGFACDLCDSRFAKKSILINHKISFHKINTLL